jgi:hypothetical protein
MASTKPVLVTNTAKKEKALKIYQSSINGAKETKEQYINTDYRIPPGNLWKLHNETNKPI